MLSNTRLALRFDAERLRADLGQVRPDEWVAHFNKQDYEGDWHAIALRAVGAATAHIYAPAELGAVFADTPVLSRCPYLRDVLAQFQCPLRSVRLLRLRAGAVIREHRDHRLGYEDGEVRFHIPITTNPDVAFVVNGERLAMEPGECWYINFNLPHRVANRGATDRVHLVVDCVVNDWLTGLLPAEVTVPALAESPLLRAAGFGEVGALERFRALVLEDVGLQEELRDIVDRELFVARVQQLGAARGCRIAAGDVEEAIRAGRRGWLERWVG